MVKRSECVRWRKWRSAHREKNKCASVDFVLRWRPHADVTVGRFSPETLDTLAFLIARSHPLTLSLPATKKIVESSRDWPTFCHFHLITLLEMHSPHTFSHFYIYLNFILTAFSFSSFCSTETYFRFLKMLHWRIHHQRKASFIETQTDNYHHFCEHLTQYPAHWKLIVNFSFQLSDSFKLLFTFQIFLTEFFLLPLNFCTNFFPQSVRGTIAAFFSASHCFLFHRHTHLWIFKSLIQISQLNFWAQISPERRYRRIQSKWEEKRFKYRASLTNVTDR